MTDVGLFPLGIALLPTEQIPLHIFELRYRELIGECLERDEPFGLVLADEEDGIRDVGTLAHVIDFEPLDDGRLNIVIEGRERFSVSELTEGAGVPDRRDRRRSMTTTTRPGTRSSSAACRSLPASSSSRRRTSQHPTPGTRSSRSRSRPASSSRPRSSSRCSSSAPSASGWSRCARSSKLRMRRSSDSARSSSGRRRTASTSLLLPLRGS